MYGTIRQRAQGNTNGKNHGFTLIELLVVVLILSILMAIAMPLYLSSVADSQNKTCRANMQTIATAVQASITKAAGTSTPLTVTGAIAAGITGAALPDLGANIPVCPTGGTYALAAGVVNTAGFEVTCTNHGSYEPGVLSH